MFFFLSYSRLISLSGPCRFLFDETVREGGKSYVQLIENRRVLLRFGLSYMQASLHGRLATVDPGRIIPWEGNPSPGFHEVCLTFTDHKSRSCHRNVDVCAMLPQPPKAKGQLLLLLCSPSSLSPYGPYGPYIAAKISKSTRKVVVRDELSQKNVSYDFDQCVRVLNDDENK